MPLIDATGNIKESQDFKFFELRKIKICDKLSNQCLQNIAISNEIIFIATQDALKIIVAKLITDFEWNSKVTQQILENYPSVIIPLSIKPNYLTVCGGKNSILVVSGPLHSNQTQTQIQFFDLTDLNVVNSELKPFSVINIEPPNTELISLEWHPEYNESLFIGILSNGALISVGANLPNRQSRILATLVQKDNSKITCASWSPKGKQFVIGKDNGEIIQIKHKDGCNFEEAKKISPDAALFGYGLNSIKWCFTPLFVTSYVKFDGTNLDVKHVTVYFKGATIQFNDHGSLCIDNLYKELRYKTDFIHLGSVILCSTSYSPEIAVLVCDDIDKQVNSWYQIMLLDSHRIELPVHLNGEQTLSKGSILYCGKERKMFKINDSEFIGGLKCPLLMIMNSDGVLCSYYISYKLDGKLVDPIVFPTKQLEFQFISQQQQSTSQASSNIIQQQQTPNKSFGTNIPQQQQNINLTPQQQQQPIQLTNEQIQQIKQIQQQQQKALQEQEKIIALQNQAAKEAELQKEKERKQIIEENAYFVAIEEEILQFTKLVCASKEKYKKINTQLIGREEEKRNLIDLTSNLENDLDNVKELLKGLDVELLQKFLLENFAMVEDAKTRLEHDKDSKLNILIKKRPLDQVTQRKLKEIDNKTIYIETNLKEINYILDQQWQDYIMAEKGKKLNTTSSLNLINQVIANNNGTLKSLETQLRILEPIIPWKDPSYKFNYKKQDIKKLASKLYNTKLDDLNDTAQSIENDDDDDLIEIKKFTKKSRENLIRILDSRPEIPLKRSSLPVDMNSSILVSAISKAKEKLKSSKRLSEKSLIKYQQQIQQQQKLEQQKIQNAINKKLIEQQQQNLIQQQQQQNLQKQIKATSTFVPPVLNQQQQSHHKSPQPNRQNTNKQPIQQQAIDKSSQQPQQFIPTIGKNDTFKFSFSVDQQNTNQFAPIDKQISVSTNQAKSTSSKTSTNTNQQEKAEFTFKPDQLNLTFEKSNLNLLSSTPIKNQLIAQHLQQSQQQQQTQKQVESTNKIGTQPLFSNSAILNQLNKLPSNLDTTKQQQQQSSNLVSNIQATNKQDDKQKLESSNLNTPKYEDISPAVTPKIDSKEQTPIPLSTPTTSSSSETTATTKPNESSIFSFDALAAISKTPVCSAFTSINTSQPLFGKSLVSPFGNQQNILQQKNTELPSSSTSNTITTTSSSLLLSTPNKTIFGTSTTSSPFITNPSLNFTSQASMSLFSQNKDVQQSVSPFASTNNPPATQTTVTTNLFGKTSETASSFKFTTTGLSQQPTNTTTNISAKSTPSTTTTASIFSLNPTSTAAATNTSSFMNLSATSNKDLTNQLPTTSNLTSLGTQQSQSTTASSVFGSTQTTSLTQQSQLTTASSVFGSTQTTSLPQQTGFGFSMCSLGGKPNPENVNKNPFGGGTIAPTTSSTSLFGNTSSSNLFTSLASNTQQPVSASFGTISSPFASTPFGSSSTFGTTPVSQQQTSIFGAANSGMMNRSTTIPQQNVSAFGSPSVFGQSPVSQPQQTSVFGSPSTFGQNSQFGSKSSFGQSPNTSQFGAKPVFGSSAFGVGNSSFGSTAITPQKTGFESFANANMPTFGSAALGSTSFESIAQSPQQQQTPFGSGFGSPQPPQNTQFGGSAFSERRA